MNAFTTNRSTNRSANRSTNRPRHLRHATLAIAAGAAVTAAPASAQTAIEANMGSAGRGAAVLSREHAQRVDNLIAQMTVEEKVGQMMQLALEVMTAQNADGKNNIVLDMDKARNIVVNYAAGSILNTATVALTPETWRSVVGDLQKLASEETRLGVPLIYGVDSVHGANYVVGATIFPHNLTLAASFEPELARLAGIVTSAETRVCGPNWNFAPVCDVARNAAWSRVFETFGEDAHLAAEMASATVIGMQGAVPASNGALDLTGAATMAATAKHFVGYSDPRTGRDRTPAYITDTDMHEIFLPPFDASFDAGVRTIMINSGDVNGIAVHASKPILTGLLREEMNYDGVAITDWLDILKLRDWHRVAETERDATRMAIEAGVDMAMTPYTPSFADTLVSLVNDGEISEARIDQSVRRILALKAELGLFESLMPAPDAIASIGSEQSNQLSLDAARRSITLLRNENSTLPLAEGAKILVAGPAADDLAPLHGSWTYSWQGTDRSLYPETPTVVDALRERFGDDNVTYRKGSTFDEPGDINAAVNAARSADVVVLCVGEEPSVEKPGDIKDLRMSDAQRRLAAALTRSGKPVVLALITNRPRIITDVEEGMDAIIWTGHPGPHGPTALAEILAGDVNPSGRLPFTYPNHVNELLPYNHKASDAIGPDGDVGGFEPLFDFGSGMSYTTFGYDALRVAPASSSGSDGLMVSVRVRNTGERSGAEVVKLYVTDEFATIAPRVRMLKGFNKVDLEAGASETVRFTLSMDDLAVFDTDGSTFFEPGLFTIRVGDQSDTIRVHADGSVTRDTEG
ncbi:MAG: glycoside hydrolase family 3 N-terminal domain-containing protein [Planctomycetota bacterium]